MCEFHKNPKPVQFIYRIAAGFYPRFHGGEIRKFFRKQGYSDKEIDNFFEMAKKIKAKDILGDLNHSCYG